jgi:hypothetical protein
VVSGEAACPPNYSVKKRLIALELNTYIFSQKKLTETNRKDLSY